MKICNILDVNIAVTNMIETVKYIKENIESLRGNYICISNVHTTVMAYENEEYKNIQNSAAIRLPDGGPLSTLSRIRGFKEAKRVTGPDLMKEIFECSQENNYRHYFYGSTEETLKDLRIKLKEKYPKLDIVGMYSPPFRRLTVEEDKSIVENINKANPDFIWIGLGAPKQEIWMYEHRYELQGVMIGVGAGFDYHAEKINRAPKFMQNSNLEWLYRLIQEPKRLFKRYLITNCKFIFYIFIKRMRGIKNESTNKIFNK